MAPTTCSKCTTRLLRITFTWRLTRVSLAARNTHHDVHRTPQPLPEGPEEAACNHVHLLANLHKGRGETAVRNKPNLTAAQRCVGGCALGSTGILAELVRYDVSAVLYHSTHPALGTVLLTLVLHHKALKPLCPPPQLHPRHGHAGCSV